MAEIVRIPVEQILDEGYQHRLEVSDESVNGLTSSIRRIGLLNPLVVCKKDDKYLVVCGHRRFRAVVLAGLKKVWCVVRDDSLSRVNEVAFAENFFRANLSAVEQASAIKDVIDSGGMTEEQVAAGLHRSVRWVQAQVNMLVWPADVLEAIHKGWLSVGAAANLALVHGESYRGFLLQNAHNNGVSARTTAAWLQAWRTLRGPEEALKAEPVPAGEGNQPAVPQAPCLACGTVSRTDALSLVMLCSGCINAIRNAGVGTG